MRPLALVASLTVVLAAGVLFSGCGSSGSSSTQTTLDKADAAGVPPGHLGAANDPKTEVCPASFHFSTDRDAIEYIQATNISCADAATVARDRSNGKFIRDKWDCNAWINDDHRYKNDESVSCSERNGPGQVGYTVRWL